MNDPSRQAGITMIEILVAILVLTLGIASVTALMIVNVNSTSSAQVYTQATIHADQLADIMRANISAYESATFASNPGTATVNCTGGTDCTPLQQAQYDVAEWIAQVAQELPAGQGFICTDSTPDDGQPSALECDGSGNNVIKLFWKDSRNEEGLASSTDFRVLAIAVVP